MECDGERHDTPVTLYTLHMPSIKNSAKETEGETTLLKLWERRRMRREKKNGI